MTKLKAVLMMVVFLTALLIGAPNTLAQCCGGEPGISERTKTEIHIKSDQESQLLANINSYYDFEYRTRERQWDLFQQVLAILAQKDRRNHSQQIAEFMSEIGDLDEAIATAIDKLYETQLAVLNPNQQDNLLRPHQRFYNKRDITDELRGLGLIRDEPDTVDGAGAATAIRAVQRPIRVLAPDEIAQRLQELRRILKKKD